MDPRTDKLRLAFALMQGLTVTQARTILDAVGDERAFFESSPEQLQQSANLTERYAATDLRRDLIRDAEAELAFMERGGIEGLYFADKDRYPHRLAQCEDAPAMLYKLGSCNLDAAHTVAIVGTRRCTQYGNNMAGEIVKRLAASVKDLVIVSGLAYGIDIAAHRAAMEAGVPTVGVLAHPLNKIYPPEHRQSAVQMIERGGALVTEYPLAQAANMRSYNFLARNRIIAGLSDITIVVESDARGGAMSTARRAVAYNRDVYAVPGRIIDQYSRGCNILIANNQAQAIDDVENFLNRLGWQEACAATEGHQRRLPLDIPPDQARLLTMIRTSPSLTVNDMARQLQLPYQQITAMLFNLEMSGLVQGMPGGRYGYTDS